MGAHHVAPKTPSHRKGLHQCAVIQHNRYGTNTSRYHNGFVASDTSLLGAQPSKGPSQQHACAIRAGMPDNLQSILFYPGYTFDAQGQVRSLYGDARYLGTGVNVTAVFIHPVFQACINEDPYNFNDTMAAADLAVLTLDR